MAAHGASVAVTVRTASAVELAATLSAPRHPVAQEMLALVGRVRVGEHALDLVQAKGPARDEVVTHRLDHLRPDEDAGGPEGELVQGLVDRALDRVLDRHQRLGDLGPGHGLEAVDHRREGHRLDVGPGAEQPEQGLLGEGSRRTQVADPHVAGSASASAGAGRGGGAAPRARVTARSSSGERRWPGTPWRSSFR